MIISKNYENCIEIKFEIENGEFVRQKLWVENFESKILSDFKLNKPKIARFLKFKFLFIFKLNFNGSLFYKKILNFDYFKKLLIFQLYKVWNRKWWEIALKIFSWKFWVSLN